MGRDGFVTRPCKLVVRKGYKPFPTCTCALDGERCLWGLVLGGMLVIGI